VGARLQAIADGLPAGTRWPVLDASAIVRADPAARGIASGLAELHADVLGLLDRADLLAVIGPDVVFDDLDDALRAFTAGGAQGPGRSG
jgi:hypothetical protein